MVLTERIGNRNIVSKTPLKTKVNLNKTKIKRIEFIDSHNFEISINKNNNKASLKVTKK